MQQPTNQSVGQRIDVPRQYLDIALVPGHIALQWPLICPCKVLHKTVIVSYKLSAEFIIVKLSIDSILDNNWKTPDCLWQMSCGA